MNNKAVRWPLVFVVFLQSAYGAEPAVHPQIGVGASFLFSQQVEGGGMKKGTYSPRLDAFAKNNAGGLIFTIASGPKTEIRGTVINQTLYALAADACVVDVINGLALRSGAGCQQPLPERESWIVKDARGTLQTCQLMQPATERVSVPAGEFDAAKIECREDEGSSTQRRVATYWYVASVGAMVKTVHRRIDSTGSETSIIAAQLVTYEPK